uniref:Uncharacterized protein n=1 Tax=Cupriavidus pinatubonensis (strain JMP 134 / LMG 1197) TaxID=264198 RepID=Q46MY4_CUPPJ
MPFPTSVRDDTRTDRDADAADDQCLVAVVRRRQGFWHDARDLTDAARGYRQSRVLPEMPGAALALLFPARAIQYRQGPGPL